MISFRTVLYSVWFLIPLVYLLIGVWASLEKRFGHRKHEQPMDYYRQSTFTFLAAIVAVMIDYAVLESLVEQFSPRVVPLAFYQMILLPLLMYIGALVVGPSAELRISSSNLLNKKGRK